MGKASRNIPVGYIVCGFVAICLLVVTRSKGKLIQTTIAVERPSISGSEFPAEQWKQVDPSAVGIDPEKLEQFRNEIGWGSYGCVVRYGLVVKHWSTWLPPILANWRGWGSATKPFIATLALFGIQEGRLSGLDQRIVTFGWALKGEDREMTIRHLINMTSGYTLPENPGERYAYNDYGVQLAKKTLVDRLYQVPGDEPDAVEMLFTAPNRLGPLQFEDPYPFSIFSVRHGGPRLNMSPCDYARFGLLMLNRGLWKDEKLIDPQLVGQILKPSVPSSMQRTRGGETEDYLNLGTTGGGNDLTPLGPGVFGAFWWFNLDRKLWPDVPPDAFQANGHWNRHALTIIPSLDLIIAWRASSAMAAGPEDFPAVMNRALKIVVDAVDSDVTKQSQEVVNNDS